ncbi:MAG: hypothetical protein LBF89_00670, partial [Bacteroidales bacterium]|nr:hypothetical protein [Bacteroidales bacterium]
PWTFEIKEFLRAGENRIEVEVYNTLGNHYLTIPTRYPGSTESGLTGPVKVILTEKTPSSESTAVAEKRFGFSGLPFCR